MRLVRAMYCHTLVSPGIGADLQTALLLSELMTELLPVFGYPMNPTEMFFLSLWKLSNCLKVWISEPLPNGFVTLAR